MITHTSVTSPSTEYKIDFVDRVLDNVHGFIMLTALERDIAELIIFKRLQSIKQLSLVNWVFPGAEHTRYAHSLGVMHIVDKMAIQLKFTHGDRQLLRIAGLLHDIGHYPLSHVGERAYELELEKSNYLGVHLNNTLMNVNKISNIKLRKDNGNNNKFHHEKISEIIITNSERIKNLISHHTPFIDIKDICDIITGNYLRNPKLSAMIQLMHSELDADRLDYSMRDASTLGINYNADINVIINNLELAKKYDVDIVGIKPKGISAADQYMLNRFFSQSQVIANRHVAALELMARTLIRFFGANGMFDFPKKDEGIIKSAEKHEDDPTFIQFTDHLFWNAVYEIYKEREKKTKYPWYIIKFAIMLTQHQEIKANRDAEFAETSLDSTMLMNKVKESPHFIRLQKNIHNGLMQYEEHAEYDKDSQDNYYIQKLHRVSVIDSMPYEKFEQLLKELSESFHSENSENYKLEREALVEKYYRFRYRDGLAVIETKQGVPTVHLLVDDPRSILNSIYSLKMVVFREYFSDRHENLENAVSLS